jgi:uridine kinase
MKTALLISGYLRGFETNIEYIKQHVIQDNQCDVYIHITGDDNDDKYLNNPISFDVVKKELNPKVVIFSNNIVFTRDIKHNNLLNQNYKFYWLNEERKRIMSLENLSYDIIVKIRPDVYIREKLDYFIEPNKIYIPIDSKMDIKKLKHSVDKHICDIIAYGDNDAMNIYFDFYRSIDKFIHLYGYVNETLLYHYLNQNNIQYELRDINYIVVLSLCNTIAITGDSGSGKTMISNIIREMFSNSFVMECDRYHKWERGDKNWNDYTHLNPEANYITKMTTDVFDLKLGNSIYQIDYDHETGKFTDKKCIESKDNIIVCGLHSLYLPKDIVNLKIYMDTDNNLRIPWKIKRDITKRGYTMDEIIAQLKDREDDFYKYIHPQKATADIIINFYTDTIFDTTTFDINADLKILLKVGIRKKYNITNIVNNQEINKIDSCDDYMYLSFKQNINYNGVLNSIISTINT